MLKPFAQAFAYSASNLPSTPASAISSIGTSVTGGNSANGSAVSLISALGFEAQLLVCAVSAGSATNTDTRSLLDILIDPAGGTSWSATPLVSGVLAGFGPSGGVQRRLCLPVRIPSGASIGAQARSLTTGRTHRVIASVFGGYKGPGSWRCGSRVVSVGVSEANYNGTLVTPGSSGAWGSWTDIPSATTTDTNLWAWNIVYGGVNGSSMSGHGIYFQIGAGSQPLFNTGDTPHLHIQNSTSESLTHHEQLGPIFFGDVPEGTQMQVRAKNHTTAPQNSGVALYAVTG